MQKNVNGLVGYTMKGTDGEIGKVTDFYFDDETWDIRHVILKTGGWFSRRDVLISPKAILDINWKDGIIPVNLTMKQMLESPDIDTDNPVSAQRETDIYGHNLWQPFWGNSFYTIGLGGIYASARQSAPANAEIPPKKVGHAVADSSPSNPHLGSAQIVTDFHIDAIDGKCGHVVDFIFDDQTWKILYIAIDTDQLFGGHKVILPVQHIKEIDWKNSFVHVDETINIIRESPLFDQAFYENPQPVDLADFNMNYKLD